MGTDGAMAAKKIRQISFRVDDTLYEYFEHTANDNKISVAELARRLVLWGFGHLEELGEFGSISALEDAQVTLTISAKWQAAVQARKARTEEK